MKNDDEILESIIAGGLIGATLGALITKNKDGAGIGAIAGAVILASVKANEKAKKTGVPLLLEENNNLVEIQKDGSKRIIRAFPKNRKQVPRKFTLK